MRNELSGKERKGPLVLTKNKSYPAYQLYATTAGKEAPENVLIISILETMKWLRRRFKEFEVPDEIKLLDPSEYEKTSKGELTSFYINKGYKFVVIWIPEDNNWCMQLTEPDLGPRTGSPDERPPVPGRLIETNIAYREVSGTVECGFKVVISEPEDESAPCEVYRLAVVKQLVENPLVGLLHKYPLSKKVTYVNSSSDLKKLSTWLKDDTRMLPAIIALGTDPDTENQIDSENNMSLFSRDFMSKIYEDSISSVLRANPMESLLAAEKIIPDPEEITKSNKEYIIDVRALASPKMGYGQYFCIPFNLIDELNKNTSRSNTNRFKSGDLLIWEPRKFNPQSPKIYSAGSLKNSMQEISREVDNMIQNYSLYKPFDFGDLLFFDIATIREKELDISSDTKLMEIKKEYKQQLEEMKEKNKTNLEVKDRAINGYKTELEKINDKIEKNKEKEEKRIEEVRKENDRLKKIICEKEIEIDRLKWRQNLPENPNEVVGWVEQSFSEKMIFHDRATDMMKKIKRDEVDMDDICLALEYLATDYRDSLLGTINNDELLKLTSAKYGRPFNVSPSGNSSVETYPKEYKIKYGIGIKGKLTEKPLNLHLKIGNTNDNLLRIYFLYDSENKLIVVGSLPRHLSTTKFG